MRPFSEISRFIIEKCFKNPESNNLNAFARSYAKLIVKESFEKIMSGDFEMPSNKDMEKMIDKELEWDFDEDGVVAGIKRNYPSWSEEQVYDEVDKLADVYENERFKHIKKVMAIECQNMVKELQKKSAP